jgi:hypothetical protein
MQQFNFYFYIFFYLKKKFKDFYKADMSEFFKDSYLVLILKL